MSVACLALEWATRGTALGPHESAMEMPVLDELPAINAAVLTDSINSRRVADYSGSGYCRDPRPFERC
jgi:hypothetical protein